MEMCEINQENGKEPIELQSSSQTQGHQTAQK